MSMGIPAIVTGWSGTADFVDDRVGYPLNYSLSVVSGAEAAAAAGKTPLGFPASIPLAG